MIYIGTSGYHFEDWIGTVYPQNIKGSEMLSYYYAVLGFKAVEINYTYYRLPSYKTTVSMLRRTPPDFVFAVKLPASVTHEGWKNQKIPVDDLKNTFQALQPMLEEGRLKAFLAQFPYSFKFSEQNMDYLASLRQMIKEPLAVEFRHNSWDNEVTFDFLKKYELTYVVVDEPQIRALFPYKPAWTTKIAYFRFHGRNEQWFEAPEGERYNYDYNETELSKFAQDILTASKETSDVFAFFNNCYRGKAVKNAISLRKMIEEKLF
ncbi:DUF72 domain-containing protein [Pseudothermotoga thermarum]|uniref:DUF72 domain-containing protein n=1 Tax=Pseudothermotoga thermarum DSM 5069 TaxID=688269 RepID=F7YW89_9THEM|nr:DUF72 domain-containing protein [Pseudothermotoga thermarum]AEH51861.1 protein of unknown function DUF72 [Pseudothermotoga thermarum DSM 5069]